MKTVFHFLLVLLVFRGSDLNSSDSFQEQEGLHRSTNPLRLLHDYEHFRTIKSISAALDIARERKKTLGCEPSDILVCLDVDYFSVRTDGGSDPLEECTVFVYQTLMQEGYKVLRLTARGQGVFIPNGSENSKSLKRGNDDLTEALGDTSVGFLSENITMSLDFPSDGPNQEFTQYGYYIQGTLFAGPYKAYMLGGFLEAIQYFPKAIIMGDDNEYYLLGFLHHSALRDSVGGEIHLLHMPAETHIEINLDPPDDEGSNIDVEGDSDDEEELDYEDDFPILSQSDEPEADPFFLRLLLDFVGRLIECFWCFYAR